MVINALIGIVQELRVKHTLDSIALLEQRPVQAVRGGEVTDVPPHELVLGDIVVLSAGCQVPADAELCTGEAEVNEALLTGEADNVRKRPGDRLLSGSFFGGGLIGQESQNLFRDARPFFLLPCDSFCPVHGLQQGVHLPTGGGDLGFQFPGG